MPDCRDGKVLISVLEYDFSLLENSMKKYMFVRHVTGMNLHESKQIVCVCVCVWGGGGGGGGYEMSTC